MGKSLINRKKVALVIQGGTLRSIFTAGVLDAFVAMNFFPFKYIVGVSGGALCMIYYLSKQYKCNYNILKQLSKNEKFINWLNMFSEQGMINLEYLEKYSRNNHPVNEKKLAQVLRRINVEIVTTSLENGEPVYLKPEINNIYQYAKASATLPFLTKGEQLIDGKKRLMDGGWSDPIPIKRAIDLGYKDIVVIRTYPAKHREDWSYVGKIGRYWHKHNPGISNLFDKSHEIYNKTADFLDSIPNDVKIHQIVPENYLNTTSYSTTFEKLDGDYRYGLQLGIDLSNKLKRKRLFKRKAE